MSNRKMVITLDLESDIFKPIPGAMLSPEGKKEVAHILMQIAHRALKGNFFPTLIDYQGNLIGRIDFKSR